MFDILYHHFTLKTFWQDWKKSKIYAKMKKIVIFIISGWNRAILCKHLEWYGNHWRPLEETR